MMKLPKRIFVRVLSAVFLLTALTEPVLAHGPSAPSKKRVRAPKTDTSSSAGLSTQPSLAVIRTAPDFSLLDPYGRPVHLADYRDRVVLLAFIYTSCPSACPLITQRMAVLQRRLADARVFPRRVSLISVTIDPTRDSGPVLARYAREFGANAEGWWFLTEKPERLRPMLAAYDEWTKPQPDGEIDHPARLHLIDGRGRTREIYSLALFDERQAFYDIHALLRESGSADR
jgi:protein SCO1